MFILFFFFFFGLLLLNCSCCRLVRSGSSRSAAAGSGTGTEAGQTDGHGIGWRDGAAQGWEKGVGPNELLALRKSQSQFIIQGKDVCVCVCCSHRLTGCRHEPPPVTSQPAISAALSGKSFFFGGVLDCSRADPPLFAWCRICRAAAQTCHGLRCAGRLRELSLCRES